MSNSYYFLRPTSESAHYQYHWIETEFGMMVAMWYPDIGANGTNGSWDINGHIVQANDPKAMREWRYVGPVIPPEETKP